MANVAIAQRMTVDEWAALDEDTPGELVDGAIEEEEMPTLVHEAAVMWLVPLLRPYFRARGGSVFGSGVKLAVRAQRGRMADLVCFAKGSNPELRGLVRTPPFIAVEVVSPSPADERRDRILKPDDYAAFGVRYYWLVDPELKSFEVWELGGDGRYAHACSAIAGRVDVVPGCPDLVLDLDALWLEVENPLG
jgi:Uma2 family endonuclease